MSVKLGPPSHGRRGLSSMRALAAPPPCRIHVGRTPPPASGRRGSVPMGRRFSAMAIVCSARPPLAREFPCECLRGPRAGDPCATPCISDHLPSKVPLVSVLGRDRACPCRGAPRDRAERKNGAAPRMVVAVPSFPSPPLPAQPLVVSGALLKARCPARWGRRGKTLCCQTLGDGAVSPESVAPLPPPSISPQAPTHRRTPHPPPHSTPQVQRWFRRSPRENSLCTDRLPNQANLHIPTGRLMYHLPSAIVEGTCTTTPPHTYVTVWH